VVSSGDLESRRKQMPELRIGDADGVRIGVNIGRFLRGAHWAALMGVRPIEASHAVNSAGRMKRRPSYATNVRAPLFMA
jgi:hypothetical protein